MATIKEIKDKYWGYAYLKPRTEKKVAEELLNRNIAHYLPLKNHARLHHGKKIITPIPIITGYIFLAISDEERVELKKTIKSFVQIELMRVSEFEKVLINDLNTLKQIELLAKNEKVVINPGIQKGDTIVITKGPLKNLETLVLRRDDDNDSIVVNLSILGKSVEYSVSAEQLQKITS